MMVGFERVAADVFVKRMLALKLVPHGFLLFLQFAIQDWQPPTINIPMCELFCTASGQHDFCQDADAVAWMKVNALRKSGKTWLRSWVFDDGMTMQVTVHVSGAAAATEAAASYVHADKQQWIWRQCGAAI